jgi:hypothetical protein
MFPGGRGRFLPDATWCDRHRASSVTAMNAFDSSWSTTRQTMLELAVHLVARARAQATDGRFSLRVTPGGFGTPEFGPDCRQLRVVGDTLLVTSDAPGAASVTSQMINGSSLRDLAAAAGVDLAPALNVGHDTPPLGDVDAPLAVDAEQALRLAQWFDLGQQILDRLALVADAWPRELARLWPEHFDVAMVVKPAEGDGINFGASPGDGYSNEPYLYVGPWGPDRPGDAGYWNAPFGATVTWTDLGDDPVGAGVAFMTEGLTRLTAS